MVRKNIVLIKKRKRNIVLIKKKKGKQSGGNGDILVQLKKNVNSVYIVASKDKKNLKKLNNAFASFKKYKILSDFKTTDNNTYDVYSILSTDYDGIKQKLNWKLNSKYYNEVEQKGKKKDMWFDDEIKALTSSTGSTGSTGSIGSTGSTGKTQKDIDQEIDIYYKRFDSIPNGNNGDCQFYTIADGLGAIKKDKKIKWTHAEVRQSISNKWNNQKTIEIIQTLGGSQKCPDLTEVSRCNILKNSLEDKKIIKIIDEGVVFADITAELATHLIPGGKLDKITQDLKKDYGKPGSWGDDYSMQIAQEIYGFEPVFINQRDNPRVVISESAILKKDEFYMLN